MKAMRSLRAAFAVAVLAASAACAAPPHTPDPPPTVAPTQALDSAPATLLPTLALAAARPGPPIPDAPPRDDFALARRFSGATATPVPTEVLYADESVGFTRRFNVFDLLNERAFPLQSVVRYVSPNAVWYFPPSADVDEQALADAAETFEREILPGVLALIAPDLQLPGRIAIVHGHFPGVAGYFNAGDALPSAVRPHGNERVGLYLGLAAPVGGRAYLGTLVHELQHLVHWLADPTESAWVHEGFAELAARSLGYDGAPFDAYRRNPGVSLRDWPPLSGNALPNYAAASLFSAYLAERFGADAIARIAADPADGAAGVQSALSDAEPGLDFEAVFADWAAANVAANAAGSTAPPYGYAGAAPPIEAHRTLDGPGSVSGRVNQFGAWLLAIEPDAPLDVTFAGAGAAPILPVAPFSGESCWWSNRGDSVNATLTRPLDLADSTAPALEFRAWWDIEPHWDHGYVSVSADGGASWEILPATSATTRDPYRIAYGPSYTGASGGWRLERADLAPFAGRRVLLRFDYVTDDAINRPGWCIDDVAVSESGFFDDIAVSETGFFDDDAGQQTGFFDDDAVRQAGFFDDAVQQAGFFDDAETPVEWTTDGFVRAGGRSVEQRFALRLVERNGSGGAASVRALPMRGGEAAFRADGPVTLVVTAFADKTSEPAAFRVRAAPSAP